MSNILTELSKDHYFIYYAIGMPALVYYLYCKGYDLLGIFIYVNTAFYTAGMVRGKFSSLSPTLEAILNIIIYLLFVIIAVKDCFKLFYLAEQNENKEGKDEYEDNIEEDKDEEPSRD